MTNIDSQLEDRQNGTDQELRQLKQEMIERVINKLKEDKQNDVFLHLWKDLIVDYLLDDEESSDKINDFFLWISINLFSDSASQLKDIREKIRNSYTKEELDNLDCFKEVKRTALEQMERFMQLSDLIMFLPGGYGTYDEIFYMISEYVNETHHNKIILMNINNYFDGVKTILNKIKEEKFASLFDFVKIVDNTDELNSLLEGIC